MTNRPEMRRGREEGAYGRKSENFPSPTPTPPPSNGGRGEGGAGLACSAGGRDRGPRASLPPLRGHGHKFARFHLGRKLRPGPLLVLSREAINLLAQFASHTTTDIAATDPKRRQRRPPPSEASSAVDDRRQRWRRRRQAISPKRRRLRGLTLE